MDRLTIEIPCSGNYTLKRLCMFSSSGEIVDIDGCQDQCYSVEEDCDKCPIRKAINRLAAYEDTELTPKQIIAMKESKL